ncbi:protein PTHB1 isoform X1 [Tachysurus ichikawai]
MAADKPSSGCPCGLPDVIAPGINQALRWPSQKPLYHGSVCLGTTARFVTTHSSPLAGFAFKVGFLVFVPMRLSGSRAIKPQQSFLSTRLPFPSVNGVQNLLHVIALADVAEETRACLVQAFSRLRSATHLLILLVSLWQGLGIDQIAILEATLLPLLQDTPQLGWEESVDAAVSHLLRTCLSRSPKDQAISLSTSQLSMPKDTSRLKKHIMLLCDRIGKGGRLSVSSEANAPTPVMMPACCEAIPESIAEDEEEDPALQQEATEKIIKKKQPSKKAKSKTGVVPNEQWLAREVEEVQSHHVRCVGIVKILLRSYFPVRSNQQ